jgi:LemA protein
MTFSLLTWGFVALLVFWAVGAYNRLVRLRSEANAAFASLDGELARQVELARQCLPSGPAKGISPIENGGTFWAGLEGASLQLTASLAAARTRPLDPERIAALDAALEVLRMAWERVERDDAHDLAGPRLPERLTAERAQAARQARAAGEQFNLAVARYNEAIAQFPAIVLAWVFGFQRGQGLAAA